MKTLVELGDPVPDGYWEWLKTYLESLPELDPDPEFEEPDLIPAQQGVLSAVPKQTKMNQNS